jgi:hypothetical protein
MNRLFNGVKEDQKQETDEAQRATPARSNDDERPSASLAPAARRPIATQRHGDDQAPTDGNDARDDDNKFEIEARG